MAAKLPAIHVPVAMFQGRVDWAFDVTQAENGFERLAGPKRLYVGQFGHTPSTFTTPDFRNGRPSGLGVTNDGKLIVCDSHYHCIRIYDKDGTELKKFGGEKGTEPGQYGYVSDAVQDADGFYYVSEFGINERITKFDAGGKFVKLPAASASRTVTAGTIAWFGAALLGCCWKTRRDAIPGKTWKLPLVAFVTEGTPPAEATSV